MSSRPFMSNGVSCVLINKQQHASLCSFPVIGWISVGVEGHLVLKCSMRLVCANGPLDVVQTQCRSPAIHSFGVLRCCLQTECADTVVKKSGRCTRLSLSNCLWADTFGGHGIWESATRPHKRESVTVTLQTVLPRHWSVLPMHWASSHCVVKPPQVAEAASITIGHVTVRRIGSQTTDGVAGHLHSKIHSLHCQTKAQQSQPQHATAVITV